MAVFRIYGRGAIGGVAEGPAMVSREPLQGWNGLNDKTGQVIELGHPLFGLTIKDSVLIQPGGKGSTGLSAHFHATKVAGFGPAALIFPRVDSRSGVAAAVLNVPVVTDLNEDIFSLIQTGDWVRVDGDQGLIEVTPRGDGPDGSVKTNNNLGEQ